MSLTRVLSAIGDDNLRYQLLAQSITKMQSNADGTTHVTFSTTQIKPQNLLSGEIPNTGIVLWLKSADWKDAAEKVAKGITAEEIWNSMLQYAIRQDLEDCATFLNLWNEGCWPEIRKDFPDYEYPGGFPY